MVPTLHVEGGIWTSFTESSSRTGLGLEDYIS